MRVGHQYEWSVCGVYILKGQGENTSHQHTICGSLLLSFSVSPWIRLPPLGSQPKEEIAVCTATHTDHLRHRRTRCVRACERAEAKQAKLWSGMVGIGRPSQIHAIGRPRNGQGWFGVNVGTNGYTWHIWYALFLSRSLGVLTLGLLFMHGCSKILNHDW